MALLKSVYEARLNASFQLPIGNLWSTCITEISNATKDFIESGTVNTNVSGTVVPPWIIPYQTTGVGIGIPPIGLVVSSATITTMIGILTSLFMNPATVWAEIGPVMATQINTVALATKVNTTDSGGLTGIGLGSINTAPAFGALTSLLTLAWTTPGSTWAIVANLIATAVDTFLKSCIVNTTDSGVSPPVFWNGTGVGTIS